MPAATITPIYIADAPTSITNLTSGPPANEEWRLRIRVANKTAASILYRLYVTTSADNTQSAGAYRAYDYLITPNDAVDIEEDLVIPNGHKVQHRASATGLGVSVTGRMRSTL